MIIHNVGYHHCHDADFYIDRPNGSGDYLLLLFQTDAIMTQNHIDRIVSKNTFFLYRKGSPQVYRCMPQQPFSNDWIHFLFEGTEEADFLSLGIPYEVPVLLDNLYFASFCIKSIAQECSACTSFQKINIQHYMGLLLNEVGKQLCDSVPALSENSFEMLSTIRNKIYSRPYEMRTVNNTAHEVRMSKSGFQHLYKKFFGVTFIQDLIESRMEYAKMLLINTNLSVLDISFRCGYNHYVHFTRQFKEREGMTPLEFRRNWAK